MIIRCLDIFKPTEGGFYIPFISGRWYRIISKLENLYIRKLSIEGFCLNQIPRKETLTVSLTSFPARIEIAGYAIKSLFHQTVKPDRIILWLAEEQFPDKKIPFLLEELQEHGLEIKYCEDIKAHKKYYYSLLNQKRNELVITYDDDLIYPENSLELLVKKHEEYPNCIVCNRAQCASCNGKTLTPYNSWKVYSSEGISSPSKKLFPSTGGGTLYPYGVINKEAFNIEDIKKYAFSADDLWMRYMSALNRIEIIKTKKKHKIFSVISDSQNESLQVENCLNGGNDNVINQLHAAFPEVMSFMFENE